MSIVPLPVVSGGVLTVQVGIRPRKAVMVSDVEVTLQGEAHVERHRGTGLETLSEVVCAETLHWDSFSDPPPGPVEIASGEEKSWNLRFQRPEDAAPTFAGSSNKVEWSVRVSVALEGLPDWHATMPVAVAAHPLIVPEVPLWGP